MVYQMRKIIILIGLSSILGQLHAGNDVIFISGFDMTGAEINCPDALPLIEMVNEFNNQYFSGSGTINATEPKVYFSVDMNMHEWFSFLVPDESMCIILKPLISIYNSEGTELLAQNAEPQTLFSSVIYRATTLSRHCIQVEKDPAFSLDATDGGLVYDFNILATPLIFEDYDDYNLDVEPNDSISEAQTGLSLIDGSLTHVVGEFGSTTDVDIYQLTTSAAAQTLNIIDFPSGPTGYGSTTDYSVLEVLSSDGVDVLARINPALGADAILMPVQGNMDYMLVVGPADQSLGDNPTYVLKWKTLDSETQQEQNNTANNLAVGAELALNITAGISPSPGLNLYQFSGMLTGSIDVDWWQFEVDPYEKIKLYCHSAHYGSGVIDAVFEVYSNPSMPALQIEVENPNTGLIWSDNSDSTMPAVLSGSDQTHYLRIAANQFSGVVLNRNYTCNIEVTD